MFPIRLAGGLLNLVSDKLTDGSLPIGGVLGKNVEDIANKLPFGIAGALLKNQNPIGGVVGGSLFDQLKDKGVTKVGGSIGDAFGNLNPFSGLAGESVSNALGNGIVSTGGGGEYPAWRSVFDPSTGITTTDTEGHGTTRTRIETDDSGLMREVPLPRLGYESPFDFLKRSQTREPEDNRRQQPFWEFKEETGGSYSDYLRSILGRRQVEESVDRLGNERWNRMFPGSFNWPVR